MNVELAKSVLLWCLVINYVILLLWFLVFCLAHEWMYRLHTRWFNLSRERFDFAHYLGMSVYKVGVLLFNLAPYIALVLVGQAR
jgi:hypothetical protein